MARSLLAALLVLSMFGLSACKAQAQGNKSVSLCDFEKMPDADLESKHFDPASALKKPMYPAHDFRWATSGYAKIEPYTKADARRAKDKELYKMIQGKGAAKVRFTVPGDFRKAGDESFPKVWESGLALSIDSHTQLAESNWSAFSYFTLDVNNLGKRAQSLRLQISDSAGNLTATSISLEPGISTVEFPLALLAAARLNSDDIKNFSLTLDTAGQTVDPQFIIDNVGLHQANVEERIRLASEEGESEEEEEDWDSEEEEGVRKQVKVSRPAGSEAPAALSGTAGK